MRRGRRTRRGRARGGGRGGARVDRRVPWVSPVAIRGSGSRAPGEARSSAHLMRASWSFRCEPLNRVAELSRSWPWFPSDPLPPDICERARGGGGAAGRVEGRVSRGRGPDARRARERESGEGRGRGARAGDPTEKMVGSRTSLSPPLPPPSPPLPEPPEFMGSSPPRRFASSSILSAARGGSWVGHERGAAGIDRPPARGPPHADARKKRPRGAKKRRGWHEKPPRGDARFGGEWGAFPRAFLTVCPYESPLAARTRAEKIRHAGVRDSLTPPSVATDPRGTNAGNPGDARGERSEPRKFQRADPERSDRSRSG